MAVLRRPSGAEGGTGAQERTIAVRKEHSGRLLPPPLPAEERCSAATACLVDVWDGLPRAERLLTKSAATICSSPTAAYSVHAHTEGSKASSPAVTEARSTAPATPA